MSSEDQGDRRPPNDSEQPSGGSTSRELAMHLPMLAAAAGFVVDAISRRPSSPLLLLVGLCGIQLVNSILRCFMGHTRERDIRGSLVLELVVGAVVLGAIGGIGLWLGPVPWGCEVAAGLIVVGCAGALLYVSDDIASGVRRLGEPMVSSWIGDCTLPARVLRFMKNGNPDDPLVSIIDKLDAHKIPLARLFRPYRKAGAEHLSEVSGARALMNATIAVAGVALVLGGLWGTESTGAPDTGSSVGVAGGGGGVGGPVQEPHGGTRHNGKEPGSEAGPSAGGDDGGGRKDSGESDCGRYGPGDGLDNRNPVRGDFELLFREAGALNATEPIEPKGRCFEPVHTMGEDGGGLYQEQYDLGFKTLKALAVYSTLWGAGLVLEPAAAAVLDLIEDEGVTLGVSPRIFVGGGGDLYLLHFEAGTMALVRRRFNRADGEPESFLRLPQAVAAAWHDRMRDFESWLWPEERPDSGDDADDGKVYYDLMAPAADGLGEQTVATVVYDSTTGTAFIEGDSGWEYGVDGAHLDFVEIGTFAEGAR